MMLPTLFAFALTVFPNTGHARALTASSEITSTAKHYLGRTYAYGHADGTGYDCSGLVQTVFHKYGVNLPRTSTEQSHWGRPVALDHIKSGDLLFFALSPTGKRITHVAIALDNDRMIHASRGHKRVVISKFDTPYFQERLRVARRLGD